MEIEGTTAATSTPSTGQENEYDDNHWSEEDLFYHARRHPWPDSTYLIYIDFYGHTLLAVDEKPTLEFHSPTHRNEQRASESPGSAVSVKGS